MTFLKVILIFAAKSRQTCIFVQLMLTLAAVAAVQIEIIQNIKLPDYAIPASAAHCSPQKIQMAISRKQKGLLENGDWLGPPSNGGKRTRF